MAGEASIAERVARRYARALYEVAKAQNAFAAVQKDIEQWVDLLRDVPALKRFIANPTHSHEDKARAMVMVSQKMGCHQMTERLLTVLARRGRLSLLPVIAVNFAQLCDDDHNRMKVSITSAHPLTEQQQQRLVLLLSDYYGKDVSLQLQLNESLLGGLRLEANHRLFDASVATVLHDMTQQLEIKGAAAW